MAQARTIDAKQAKALFAFIKCNKNAERNAAMFSLSYHCALRVCEIAALTIGDVLNKDKTIKSVVFLEATKTKGKKGREFFINSSAKKHIATLIKSMPNPQVHQPLIQPMGKYKHFTANSLSITFKNMYESAGLYGCSSHSGRRSCATALAQNGVSIRIIQKVGGWASLQSVAPYLDANEEMIKNAVELQV
jgi:integrase/recombinase XerD